MMKHAEGKFFFMRKAVGDILRAENNVINQLRASRNAIVGKIKNWMPDENWSFAIDSFLFKGDSKYLKGQVVRDFLERIPEKQRQSQRQRQSKVEAYIEQFKKVGGRLVSSLIDLRQRVVDQLTGNKSFLKIGSEILLKDEKGREKAEYLLKQLGYLSKLKLLFCASQHSFSATKFHELCDNIPNTVTIVRTEFNRTIAASTPLKWQATHQWTSVADPSLSSFLLNLELREKMAIIKGRESYAIQNSKNCGPMFGGGDLLITDKCNQVKSSTAYIPTSYNCDEKYRVGQKSWTAFSGAQRGYQFRVVEYEIFQVIK